MICLTLFWNFLMIGTLSFGGGYGMISLVREVVLGHGWLTESEFLSFIAVSESTPGPLAVNMATFIGSSQAGLPGALVAIAATILPPFVIISAISFFYALFRDNFVVSRLLAGMQAGVAAVIASVVWDMGGKVVKQKSVLSVGIMLAAFMAVCVYRVNVVIVILTCIGLGILRALLAGRKKA